VVLKVLAEAGNCKTTFHAAWAFNDRNYWKLGFYKERFLCTGFIKNYPPWYCTFYRSCMWEYGVRKEHGVTYNTLGFVNQFGDEHNNININFLTWCKKVFGKTP
jgi:hypothetical protein